MKDKVLYNSFLKQKRIYNLNVGYWKKKIIRELDVKFSEKNVYVENKQSNGKSFFDGNPIFTYTENRKAYRIIQENPDELDNFNDIKLLEAWFDNVYIYEVEGEVQELVISLYLTKETVEKALKLIRLWSNNTLNKQNLNKYI